MKPSTLEVPIRSTHSPKPIMRMIEARRKASSYFPIRRMIHETWRVRPANFLKWVKKFNGSFDPYNYLASFKKVARAEQVHDLHTKVKGGRIWLDLRRTSTFIVPKFELVQLP